MNPHEQKIAEAMGYDKAKPHVQFFDHAVPDKALSDASGRPRFRERVYIRKIPSAPDLVVRDVFDRAMEEQDKTDFPREWAHYLERKKSIDDLNPPVSGLPGMNVAAEAELKALGLYTCRQFVEYEGVLDGLEELRETAKEVLKIGEKIREKRNGVRTERGGQVHRHPGFDRPSEAPKIEENGQEISYSFKVNL